MQFSPKFLILFAVLCGIFKNSTSANNETLKIRLNYPFFKFFSNNAHHLIDKEIPKIQIPEVQHIFWSRVGRGVVWTNDLKFDNFQTPTIDFKLLETGINWITFDGSIRMSGRWHSKFHEIFIIRDSGSVHVSSSGINMNIAASIYELDGQPQVKIGGCTVIINKLDVKIGGGVVGWLVNLFRSEFSKKIKREINSQACKSVQGILINQANQFLHSLPSHVQIGYNFSADYSLTQNPTFSSNFTEFDLAADIVYGKSECHAIKTSNWTDVGPSPGMITSWISVSIPNCLVESAHQNRLVQLVLSKSSNPAIEPYLRTSCGIFGLCIGKFFSKLRTQYPNSYIDFLFHTYQTPLFSMTEKDGIMLNISLAVDLFVNPYVKTKQNILARLVVDTSSEVEPYLKDAKIRGRLLNSTITTYEAFSNIGNFSTIFLGTFSKIFGIAARQAVKTILNVGFSIPSYNNISLANSSRIEVFDQYIRTNIDFEYK